MPPNEPRQVAVVRSVNPHITGRRMNTRLGMSLGVLCFAAAMLHASQLAAQIPPAIVAAGESIVATYHGEGAQIYECRHDQANKLFWMMREPIATLLFDGKTVGF